MKRLIIAGVLVFLVVLVVSFPARVAYRWFAPPDLQLSGISGSVWKGFAAEGLAGGAYLQSISWQLKPSALLTGELAFETSASPAAGTVNTDVAIGLGGSLALTNLSGSVPLDLVHEFRERQAEPFGQCGTDRALAGATQPDQRHDTPRRAGAATTQLVA